MEIQVNNKKIKLVPLDWNSFVKVEEKFGSLEMKVGKTMAQSRFSLWLSIQQAGHKDVTEEQVGQQVSPDLIPEISKALFPENRTPEKRPLA